MKISIIHLDLGIGGAERLVINMAICLKRMGHDVRILTSHHDVNHCFEETKKDGILHENVHVIGGWIPHHIFGNRFTALFSTIRMCYVVFALLLQPQHYPECVLIDGVSTPVPLLYFANIPTLFYCHFPDLLLCTERSSVLKKIYRLFLDTIEEYTLGCADILFVNSEFTNKVVQEVFPRICRYNRPIVLYPTLEETVDDDENRNNNNSNSNHNHHDHHGSEISNQHQTAQVTKPALNTHTSVGHSESHIANYNNSQQQQITSSSVHTVDEIGTDENDANSTNNNKGQSVNDDDIYSTIPYARDYDFVFVSLNRYERKKQLSLALEAFALLKSRLRTLSKLRGDDDDDDDDEEEDDDDKLTNSTASERSRSSHHSSRSHLHDNIETTAAGNINSKHGDDDHLFLHSDIIDEDDDEQQGMMLHTPRDESIAAADFNQQHYHNTTTTNNSNTTNNNSNNTLKDIYNSFFRVIASDLSGDVHVEELVQSYLSQQLIAVQQQERQQRHGMSSSSISASAEHHHNEIRDKRKGSHFYQSTTSSSSSTSSTAATTRTPTPSTSLLFDHHQQLNNSSSASNNSSRRHSSRIESNTEGVAITAGETTDTDDSTTAANNKNSNSSTWRTTTGDSSSSSSSRILKQLTERISKARVLLVIAGGYDAKVQENAQYLEELKACADGLRLNYTCSITGGDSNSSSTTASTSSTSPHSPSTPTNSTATINDHIHSSPLIHHWKQPQQNPVDSYNNSNIESENKEGEKDEDDDITTHATDGCASSVASTATNHTDDADANIAIDTAATTSINTTTTTTVDVVFRTSISTPERQALLRTAIALLYTPDREHFGIVPLEAMVESTAVIAVDSGGPKETIVNGKTGFLCPQQAQVFSQAMLSMILPIYVGSISGGSMNSQNNSAGSVWNFPNNSNKNNSYNKKVSSGVFSPSSMFPASNIAASSYINNNMAIAQSPMSPSSPSQLRLSRNTISNSTTSTSANTAFAAGLSASYSLSSPTQPQQQQSHIHPLALPSLSLSSSSPSTSRQHLNNIAGVSVSSIVDHSVSQPTTTISDKQLIVPLGVLLGSYGRQHVLEKFTTSRMEQTLSEALRMCMYRVLPTASQSCLQLHQSHQSHSHLNHMTTTNYVLGNAKRTAYYATCVVYGSIGACIMSIIGLICLIILWQYIRPYFTKRTLVLGTVIYCFVLYRTIFTHDNGTGTSTTATSTSKNQHTQNTNKNTTGTTHTDTSTTAASSSFLSTTLPSITIDTTDHDNNKEDRANI